MNTLIRLGCTALMIFGMCCTAVAGQAEDAKAMVQQALDMFKDKGKKVTLETVNDRNGPFVKGDIYLFAMSTAGVVIAHPVDHTIRRVNLMNFKDGNGTPFVQQFTEVVQAQGEGWVDYLWAKVGSGKQAKKRTYVKTVPGEDLYIGAGYYLE